MILFIILWIVALPATEFTRLHSSDTQYKDDYNQLRLVATGSASLFGNQCCKQCMAWHGDINYISYDGSVCKCQKYSANGNVGTKFKSGFQAGSCDLSSSGRKKRENRIRRNTDVNLAKVREIECAQTSTAGYWKYDYTIPSRCYGLYHSFKLIFNFNFNF